MYLHAFIVFFKSFLFSMKSAAATAATLALPSGVTPYQQLITNQGKSNCINLNNFGFYRQCIIHSYLTAIMLKLLWLLKQSISIKMVTYFCLFFFFHRPDLAGGQSPKWYPVYYPATATGSLATASYTTNAARWSASTCYTTGLSLFCTLLIRAILKLINEHKLIIAMIYKPLYRHIAFGYNPINYVHPGFHVLRFALGFKLLLRCLYTLQNNITLVIHLCI